MARPKISAAPQAVAPAVSSSLLSEEGSGGQHQVDDARAGQEFLQVQRYRRNPNSPPPPPVLQTFRWLREGDAVRIIDDDGSVYTGEIQSTGGAAERFVIRGINRTLKADIVFEGVLLPASGGQSVATETGVVPVVQSADATGQIQGRAIVGGSTRLEITAIPRAD
jgi:hypothetical protein